VMRGTGVRIGWMLDPELDCVIDHAVDGSRLQVTLGKLDTDRAVALQQSNRYGSMPPGTAHAAAAQPTGPRLRSRGGIEGGGRGATSGVDRISGTGAHDPGARDPPAHGVFSQRAAADALGVHKNFVWRIEGGQANPSYEVLSAMAFLYELRLEDLLRDCGLTIE
jgi:DNA-binding XRE family transcriptional regulator